MMNDDDLHHPSIARAQKDIMSKWLHSLSSALDNLDQGVREKLEQDEDGSEDLNSLTARRLKVRLVIQRKDTAALYLIFRNHLPLHCLAIW